MDYDRLREVFNSILESTVGVSKWNPNDKFVFEGKNIPEDINGFETFSDQFQSKASMPRKCFTSEIVINPSGKLFTVSCFVIELENRSYPLLGWFPIRWFNINIVFDADTNVMPESCSIKMYEDGKEDEDFKIPIPPLPGVLGNAVELASWGVEFIEWIKKYLPDDWGALGLAVSEIAQMINMAIISADSVIDGKTNLMIMESDTLAMWSALTFSQDFKPDGIHGYCKIVPWNKKGDEARIYQPRVLAEAASWTMLLKTDRMRSWVYNDDHLIISISGDYSGNIIGVLSSWKFVDENPEEGEFSKSSTEEGQSCLDLWQAEVRNYLGSPIPKEFVQWYLENYLRPWKDLIYSLKIKEPDNPK